MNELILASMLVHVLINFYKISSESPDRDRGKIDLVLSFELILRNLAEIIDQSCHSFLNSLYHVYVVSEKRTPIAYSVF